MKNNLYKILPFLSIACFPLIASAQGLTDTLTTISGILRAILPILVSLGVIYFVWGVVQYFIGDSEEAKKNGRDRIIYGIIGLAVIVSIWGLVAIVTQTLNLGGAESNAPDVSNLVAPSGTKSCAMGTNVQGVLSYFTCIIGQSIIPFIFAIAIMMFIWGAVKFFIINADEEAKRAQGKQFMIWGIIALAVMISVWGLVGILGSTFGIGTSVLPTVRP